VGAPPLTDQSIMSTTLCTKLPEFFSHNAQLCMESKKLSPQLMQTESYEPISPVLYC